MQNSTGRGGRNSDARTRREPSFDSGRPAGREGEEFRLRPEDRTLSLRKPGVTPQPVKTVAERAARKASAKGNGRGRPRSRKEGRKRRPIVGRLFIWSLTLCVWGMIGLAGLAGYYFTKLPPIDQLAVPKRAPNVAILASDGSLIANRGETGGRTVSLSELPAYAPKAFVAIEDRRFYSHFGIDPIGLGRALAVTVWRRGHGGMQGGSTLTQQLAKNLFLTQERTVSRKMQEAILAVWLERNYTKNQILELYLNRVYFGAGAYGIEAAAQRYFSKPARSLSLAEAAMLAGVVQAPGRLAPNRNPDAAEKRADIVLADMRDQGFITKGMEKVALAHPAQAIENVGGGAANYAADYVMDVLDEKIGALEGDITVSTTIDSRLQALAEHVLGEELDAKGGKLDVGEGALVALGPDGAVKALVGGRDYAKSQFNRATSARRQPGSSFKPFTYLTAIENGLTPDTVREDGPINIKGWKPENYTHEYFGPVTLKQAFAMSLNTVAVRLAAEFGPKAVTSTAARLGIQSPLQATPSIALGTSEVTPLELVTAYATFANGGIGVDPHVIASVKTANGRLLYRQGVESRGRVIDQTAHAMMIDMMRETLLTGTARKAEIPNWDAAGKTGTTQDYRDAWFVGYTATLVTGVWLGNDDDSPMKKVTGSGLPAEIWNRFMRAALAGSTPVALPASGWEHAPGSLDPSAPPVASAPIASAPSSLPGSGNAQANVVPAPMVVNAGGEAGQAPAGLLPDGGLRPPASIPNIGSGHAPAPQPRPKSFLEAIFGN
ncbi:MAG: PBP1A family penicillin-binding protein [Hyphomicrobiales bacterium]|nr:PBP1A family penicillin-binding protein [Hyphomicrobiales bacterium]